MFISEVVALLIIFALLISIVILQLKFFRLHQIHQSPKWTEKRSLLLTTVVFSISILYRAIFNLLKQIY